MPSSLVHAIDWTRAPAPRLRLLDQRLLPATTAYVDVPDTEAGWRAIKVREEGGDGGRFPIGRPTAGSFSVDPP